MPHDRGIGRRRWDGDGRTCSAPHEVVPPGQDGTHRLRRSGAEDPVPIVLAPLGPTVLRLAARRTVGSHPGALLPLIAGLAVALAGGVSGAAGPPVPFATRQRIVYSDGLHSENTEMLRFRGRILLVFRGGEEGQVGSARARIKVFESRDDGRTFTLLSEVSANSLPGGRDIRDPKLVEMRGRLFLYAISRLPGFHYRDLGGQAWTVRAESTDGGRSWSAPVRTYEDVDAEGKETFWGFWRYTKRTYTKGGKHRRTLFATGYQDFDT